MARASLKHWWELTGPPGAAERVGSPKRSTDMRDSTWKTILDAEVQRWAARSCEQLAAELRDVVAYEITLDSRPYQVEVEILENTDDYLHVRVAVDDGTLPHSLFPLTQTFISRRQR